MKPQVEQDEISSNDIMAALFRADMLSYFAAGQVASIFIMGRNLIYTQSSLTDSSLYLLDAPRYLCLLSDSAEWRLNQTQSEVYHYLSLLLERKRKIK